MIAAELTNFKSGDKVEAFDPITMVWRRAELLKHKPYRGTDGWDIAWLDIPERIPGGPMPSTGGWNYRIRGL